MIIIPHQQLEEATLAALIEEFVSRDGAVHGHADPSARAMTDAVLRQLRNGAAVIAFDEETETATIVLKEQARSQP
jgi:uncharacterized protein